MSIKLMLFFMMSFFLLNGCLYSCNYQPKDDTDGGNGGDGGGVLPNQDPCDIKNDTTFLRFIDISQFGQRLKITMMMKLPCTAGKGQQVYSLAFYNAKELVEPTSLYSLNFKGQVESFPSPSCSVEDNKSKLEVIKSHKDYYALSQGAAISLVVGKKSTSTLFPLYVKTSINSSNPVGDKTVGNCLGGVDYSPFNVDPIKITAIYQNDKPITSIKKGGLLNPELGVYALYSQQLVSLGAPFYTYGTLLEANGTGILPTKLETKETRASSYSSNILDGSLFEFEVALKPGSYYIAFSQVSNPTAALGGDFSLEKVSIYNKYVANQFRDYKTECGNTVTCGSVVTVK